MARGKRPQKSQGSTKGKRAFMLRGPNRELVMDEAEGMIARRMKPAEMRKKLGKAHGLNGKQVELLVTAVNKRWAQAGGHEQDRKGRRQEYERLTLAVWEDAHRAKQFGVCLRAIELLAKMHGLMAPQKHDHRGIPAPTAAAGAQDEFDGRSIEDLDYYVEHGHFPEEAAGAVEDVTAEGRTPDFPLH